MKPKQRELAGAGEVFNLASETAVDGAREIKERLQRLADEAEASAYQMRMQRTFKECPGFVGGDVPDGEQKRGRVEVAVEKAPEAMAWLKKRFHVAPAVELNQATQAIAFDIVTRRRGRPIPGQQKPKPFSWKKPEQFALSLGV